MKVKEYKLLNQGIPLNSLMNNATITVIIPKL